MNYHDIKKCNMLNGEGLRVVLFVSGCDHFCKGCHNPETWDNKSGILFDENALKEIYEELKLDYIDGLTLSGGDPLNQRNLNDIYTLVTTIKTDFPDKTIWIYSGYTMTEIEKDMSIEGKIRKDILKKCDVFVDGKYNEDLTSQEYPFAGSINQTIINL